MAAPTTVAAGTAALSSRLGVVIVTSVVKSHPNTELMEKVVASFKRCRGLEACRIIIVCDGARKGDKYQPKKGRATQEALTNYDEYKRRLHRLCGRTMLPQAQPEEGEAVAGEASALAQDEGKEVVEAKRPRQDEGREEEPTHLSVEEDGAGQEQLAPPSEHWRNTEIIELPERMGFGHAVHRGLVTLDTEYVLVVQHDHSFMAGECF
jgi:hypothetical protein